MSEIGFIKENDFVLIECNSAYVFLDRVYSSRKIKIHHAKFGANKIVGLRFGSLVEVVDSEVHEISEQNYHNLAFHGIDEDEGSSFDAPNPCEIKGDNRNLIENPENQKLSEEEIKHLKKTGYKGAEVVSFLAQNSSTFNQKTIFSKEKYLKRKHKKHRIIIRLLKPTVPTLTDWSAQRGRQRIGGLSSDAMSQILSYGNVSHGGRFIIFDNIGGLVLLSVVHRMGGGGQILDLHTSSQPTHVVYRKIFEASCSSDAETSIIESWPLQYTETLGQEEFVDWGANDDQVSDAAKQNESEKDKEFAAKAERRKVRYEKLKSIWNLIKEGQFDGLIIATRSNPLPVLQAYFDYVALSRPIVIFHQNRELLTPCFNYLVNSGRCVMAQMVSNLTREIQVLPGRTHPVIQMPGPSGYILYGTTAERFKSKSSGDVK